LFLFFKANKDLWENPKVMEEVIVQLKAANGSVEDDEAEEEDEEDEV
jgi:hypothetical protein